jgi:hypothetical protein
MMMRPSIRASQSQSHLRFHLLQPVHHPHVAVHRCRSAEVFASPLALVHTAVEFAEAEMACPSMWGVSASIPRRFSRDGQELRNMFMRTPQLGLWFIAGSFAFCPRLPLEPPSSTYLTRSYSPLPVW